MITSVKTALAVLVGVGIGAVSMNALRAQANPLAYFIAEITVRNEDGYTREFLPASTKAIEDAGGKYIVRGGQPIAVSGQPPAQLIAVVQFENIDKLSAFIESAAFKNSQDLGDRYADIRIYGVQGVSR